MPVTRFASMKIARGHREARAHNDFARFLTVMIALKELRESQWLSVVVGDDMHDDQLADEPRTDWSLWGRIGQKWTFLTIGSVSRDDIALDLAQRVNDGRHDELRVLSPGAYAPRTLS